MAFDKLAQDIQKMLTNKKWWVVPRPTDLQPNGGFKIMKLPKVQGGIKIKFYLTRGNPGKQSIFYIIAHMRENQAKELKNKLDTYYDKQ